MAGHDYLWLPSAGGDVGVAANWSDTGGASNGTLPGSADEGEFANSVGGTITGNITVFEWIIDPGAGLNTFVGDTTARFFEVNANTALDGNWIQNGSGTLDQIYIAAGTLTLGSGAELISKATGASALGLAVDGALVANGGTIVVAAGVAIGGELDLSSGATAAVSGLVAVGATAGGSGAEIAIDAATLTVRNQLQIGFASTGTLIVSHGGQVSTPVSLSFAALVAGGSGSTGLVDIKDAGSELNAGTNQVQIGVGGAGTLTAEGGGTLVAGNLFIAEGGTGTVDLTGAATTIKIGAGGVGVGEGGTGQLTLEQGATLSITGGLNIGVGGDGSLTAEGGGTLVAGGLFIAEGGTGTADLTGAATTIKIGTGGLGIGEGGTGQLTLEQGATLSITGGLNIGVGSTGIGTFDIESGATLVSQGAAIGGFTTSGPTSVPGTGTVLLNNAEWQSSGQIEVGAGQGGTGTLDVENGATLTSVGATIGGLTTSQTIAAATGSVLVDAAYWQSNGQIEVGGGSGGTAQLQVEDGATLQATATLAATNPFLIVDENIAGNASIDVGGTTTLLDAGNNSVIIGNAGFGTLTVHDGAVLDAGNAGKDAAFVLGSLSGSDGVATVTGAASRIDVNGGAVIGESGAGTLSVGGTFSVSGNLDLGVNKSASGTLDVGGAGSDLAVTGQIVVGGETAAGGTGVLALALGGTMTAGGLAMFAGGTLTIDGTSGAVIGTAGAGVAGDLVVDAGATAFGSGEIAASVINHGDVLAQGGTLDITGQSAGDGIYQIATGATLDLDNPGDVRIQFSNTTGTVILGTASGAASLVQFSGKDTLHIVGIGGDATARYLGDTATVTGPDGSWTFTFAGLPPDLQITTEGNDALVVACFLEGTMIATPAGEVPVERLTAGDAVSTLRGKARRISWVGAGRVLATRGRRTAATPVIVRKSALADNVPYRDLRITKGHSLYIDDVLIPVEYLVNHRSIAWDDRAQEVTVYHIELETHDVLLANGVPAESYRDDGNRWLFQNANSAWVLPPQEPCAPVLTGGPIVDSAWRRLLERAGPRNALQLTDDPDLHLLVDGERIDAIEQRNDTYVFRLHKRPKTVRIRSRAGVPQELGIARDDRPLGVTLRQIVLAQPRRCSVIEADAASLCDGFHAFEAADGIRWTDGDAAVPAELFADMNGPSMLLLHLGGATRYLDCGMSVRAA